MDEHATADELEALIKEAMSRQEWDAVADLERRIDAIGGARPVPAIGAVALWYAEQGLRVFPLQPGLKVPHQGSRGCKDATSDLNVIRQWWEWYPESNLAIATGHLVDVIDIDGPVGVDSWLQFDDLPDALGTVSTPRKAGSHLYVAATGDGNSAGIFPGIDYRGVGGYVVAPPSVSVDGRRYRWRKPLDVAAMRTAAA